MHVLRPMTNGRLESTSVSEAQHGTTSGHNTLRTVNRYTHSCRVSRLIFQLPLLLEQLLDCGYVSVMPHPHRETLSIVFRLSVCCDWDSHGQQVAQLWHWQRDRASSINDFTGVYLRLNYRLKGYFSRHCDVTQFTLTHHMVNKPFLLLGLAAEYKCQQWCDQHCGQPSDVYDTDWRTKLTALETISRWLLLKKKRKNRSLSHPLGHLGATYALHPWLAGKPVVDFIFVLIELSSLSLTLETLWAEIGRSGRFSKGEVTLSADFRVKGASPTNYCWHQSSRMIALSCGIKISAVHHLDLSQSTRVTDRQTDRITTPKTALAYARAVKRTTVTWWCTVWCAQSLKQSVAGTFCVQARVGLFTMTHWVNYRPETSWTIRFPPPVIIGTCGISLADGAIIRLTRPCELDSIRWAHTAANDRLMAPPSQCRYRMTVL